MLTDDGRHDARTAPTISRPTHAGEARAGARGGSVFYRTSDAPVQPAAFSARIRARGRRERGRRRTPGQLHSRLRAAVELSQAAPGLGTWLARDRSQPGDRSPALYARPGRLRLRSKSELPLHDKFGDGALERVAASAPFTSLELSRSRDEVRDVFSRRSRPFHSPFRAVFMLREIEGLSVEETADYLGIPVATVKTPDYRARLLLARRRWTDLRAWCSGRLRVPSRAL